MTEKKATQIATKAMLMSRITGIDLDDVIRYLAAVEIFEDADLMELCKLTKLKSAEVCELFAADRDSRVWW